MVTGTNVTQRPSECFNDYTNLIGVMASGRRIDSFIYRFQLLGNKLEIAPTRGEIHETFANIGGGVDSMAAFFLQHRKVRSANQHIARCLSLCAADGYSHITCPCVPAGVYLAIAYYPHSCIYLLQSISRIPDLRGNSAPDHY